jgi:hypothetical protein
MSNIGSTQGANRLQLEPLEAVKPRNNPVPNNNDYSSNSSGLQSLDTVMANSYTDPNNNIPTSDILAPIDAMNPEIPGMDKQDTRERGLTGFIGGVFKGFGKAGLDTVKGVATLGKVVVSAVSHPKEAINYVGGGIKYAINNPVKTVKTIAIDLPIGIVKGFVDPYATAVKDGKWGEAVGRGVFDVGMVLLTAGVGESGSGASKGAGAIEKVGKGSSKGAKAIESIAENADLVDDVASSGTKIITKGVEGGVKIGKDAIKITGNVKGNVIINIGNATTNVTTGASKASKAARILEESAGAIEKVTRNSSKVVKATESAGRISLGLGDLGTTLGKGASKIGELFKPIGSSIGHSASSGLTTLLGEQAAGVITRGASSIGHGISVGGKFIKDGAIFVKAHPIASSLIAGKTVDIIDKGLRASDNYDPGYIK